MDSSDNDFLKGSPNEWYKRGIAFYDKGNYNDAISCFNTAIDKDNKYFKAWIAKGNALNCLHSYNEAIPCFDKALAINPQLAYAWSGKAVALFMLKKFNDSARHCIQKALDINPNNKDFVNIQKQFGSNQKHTVCQNPTPPKPIKNPTSQSMDISQKTTSPVKTPPIWIAKPVNQPILQDPSDVGTKQTPQKNSRPELTIALDTLKFLVGRWHKLGITLTNTGFADANEVTFTFSNEVKTKGIKPVTVINRQSLHTDISILPKTEGNILLEVTLNFKDSQGKEYEKEYEFWVDVIEIIDPASNQRAEKKALPVIQSSSKTAIPNTFPLDLADQYTEVSFIGKGGFAQVFKAKRKDGTYVAVKIPISMDEATGRSFISEMQTWKATRHNNIVKMYDSNILPIIYVEEELCDSTLADQKKPMVCEEAAWILFSICEGLKFAHERKIIHRDLKPQNILIKNGVPKISDWGLSRAINESISCTPSAFTPPYAAPEHIHKNLKDERTDIWQLGVIFYELVTGALPFTGDSMLDVMSNIATKNPTLPSVINPSSRDVDAMIMRCLEKNPDNRYQSALEFQGDLALYLRISFKESFKASVTTDDHRRSAVYCGKLLMVNLRHPDIKEAYKNLLDLIQLSKGEVKSEAQELSEQLKMRIERGFDEIPEELILEADSIVHHAGMGFTNRGKRKEPDNSAE